MALRVLLADESSSIHKVFQLSLQDFSAEIKPVHLGLDVIEVAKEFKPDIIFADILLQKLNGYEVCSKVKNTPGLTDIPVVLMWSNFMNLDQEQFLIAKANGRLEKPFDTDALRGIITELVTQTHSNPVSAYITPPAIELDFDDDTASGVESHSDFEMPQKIEQNLNELNAELESLNNDPEAFEIQNISEDDTSEWAQQKTESLQVTSNAPIASLDLSDIEDKVDKAQAKISMDDFQIVDLDSVNDEIPDGFLMANLHEGNKPKQQEQNINISEEQLELALKSISQEALEKIIWRVVPDLASQIIEKEIKRLLDEKETL